MIERVQVGDMAFTAEGREGIGAVRALHQGHFVLYVENGGEFDIPASAIARVHDGKVLLDPSKLTRALLQAIGHAHDREDPRVAG